MEDYAFYYDCNKYAGKYETSKAADTFLEAHFGVRAGNHEQKDITQS
jgi:hypothetical protein